MTLTINLALDETNHVRELERFSGVLLNSLDRDMLFRQKNNFELNGKDILSKGNSILEMQNIILKTDKILSMPLIEMFPNILGNSIKNINMLEKSGGNLF